MNRRRLVLTGLLIVVTASVAVAYLIHRQGLPRHQRSPLLAHLEPNSRPAGDQPADRTVADMFVPEGFRVDLVAAEPRVRQPIAFTFDERGRIWLAEALCYPQKQAEGEGVDSIVILEDRDGDGEFESRNVFAEGLNLISGLEVGHGGVWVGAAPELLFIPDRDRDDRPDGEPRVLLDGFGFEDTHSTLNNLTWGPDGWLYGNQGVFIQSRVGRPGTPDDERLDLSAGVWRFHPVRHEFEIFARGGSNQWGLDFDERGQLFMSHCRSLLGGGPITHVVKGGHYWDQLDRNYESFVSSGGPTSHPLLRNYLMASARHGHGQGGAGGPGSDWRCGGHVHVGTMIYLGDNWPSTYRDHLFTHNLNGNQLNHEINVRDGSGFETVHAESDVLFCQDEKYVPVDLEYGPDGAVYIIDWYDRQNCHSPYPERWERDSGRIYRLVYEDNWKPSSVNLTTRSDAELVALQLHRSDWYVRMARRILGERAAARALDAGALEELQSMAARHQDATRRLRALWALHAIGALDDELAIKTLADADEYVRAWTIQLVTQSGATSARMLDRLGELARVDPSPVVRLYLASAMPCVPEETRWQLAAALSQHEEDNSDPNLPKMLWYGMAPLVPNHLDRAFEVASASRLRSLPTYVRWYAARQLGEGLDRVVSDLAGRSGAELVDNLTAIVMALDGQIVTTPPRSWKGVASDLHHSNAPNVRWLAAELAARFGDASAAPRLRTLLADADQPLDERRKALRILCLGPDKDSAEVFFSLLDEEAFRREVIRLLSRLEHPATAEKLLALFPTLSEEDRAAVVSTMCARPSLAAPLLDAAADGRIDRSYLTSVHVRQLGSPHGRPGPRTGPEALG